MMPHFTLKKISESWAPGTRESRYGCRMRLLDQLVVSLEYSCDYRLTVTIEDHHHFYAEYLRGEEEIPRRLRTSEAETLRGANIFFRFSHVMGFRPTVNTAAKLLISHACPSPTSDSIDIEFEILPLT